jgi:hypothetical protein
MASIILEEYNSTLKIDLLQKISLIHQFKALPFLFQLKDISHSYSE